MKQALVQLGPWGYLAFVAEEAGLAEPIEAFTPGGGEVWVTLSREEAAERRSARFTGRRSA